jgi:ferric-dicitrate binding protein FerR (iron transport regulator)
MNEDYLWDKSGEPDPEIEQLEKALGSLRFKRPQEPLPLPATTPRWSFRLSFSPALAAAAALLILLLAGGVWLSLRRSSSPANPAAIATGAAPREEKRVE